MKTQIEAYLETKKLAWSEISLNTESSKLRKHAPDMKLGPQAHYEKLSQTHKPYSVKGIFKRLALFEEEMLGTTKYKTFMKLNGRLFKHAYEKKKIEIGFEEARRKIESLKDMEVRAKALQLLTTGMRYSESFTLDDKNLVTGKGGKRRRVYNSKATEFVRSHTTFWRHLKRETGLTPHDLRRLYITHLLDQGMQIHVVAGIVGHGSIETTAGYAQTKREEVLSEQIRKMVG